MSKKKYRAMHGQELTCSQTGVGIIAVSILDLIIGELVLSREDTPTDRVVGIEGYAIVLETMEQLGGDEASDRVVHSLVDRGTDVSVLLTDLVDLSDVPGWV